MSDQKTVEAVIRGHVQGVWFRAWTEAEAGRHGLAGWVMNKDDGSVQALFHGGASAVDAMLAACWQGPPAATVDEVEVAEVILSAPPEGFRIRR